MNKIDYHWKVDVANSIHFTLAPVSMERIDHCTDLAHSLGGCVVSVKLASIDGVDVPAVEPVADVEDRAGVLDSDIEVTGGVAGYV